MTTLTKLITVFLAFICIPLFADETAWPFFAMDTAVQSLERINEVKQLGYSGIGWKQDTPEKLEVTVKRLREMNLKLFAIYAGANLTKTDLTWAKQLEDDLTVLKGTGAIVWLPIYSKEFMASAIEGDAVAVPALIRLADLAAKHEVRIAVYPHIGAWAERVQDAVRIAKQVNRPNFGVTFNLCHCLMVGDEPLIPELLEQATPHMFVVTINGADAGAARTGWNRLIRPLDEGNFDLKNFLNKLRELKYSGPIGLQGYGVKLPAEENLRRSMNAWKQLVPAQP